ncbi:MAG: ATP-dependent helicase, partial [Anaerolineae bacterium]|nr:ATP-dependent helicase [Anaerolineae bacterium]
EYSPNYGRASNWLSGIHNKRGRNYVWYLSNQGDQKKLLGLIGDMRWTLDTSGNLLLDTSKSYLKAGIPKDILSNLIGYRQSFWGDGELFHDDVLYFAYRILADNPLLLDFLSSRFPYLFVDEFQDTNPIQTQIVKWLALAGTTVGVVGDAEQSIYGFQGASQEDFLHFALPGIDHNDYVINGNRRSTASIVRLLNHVRSDTVKQEALRQIEGTQIEIHVGNYQQTIPVILSDTNDNVCILARRNSDVAALRNLYTPQQQGLWDKFEAADSSSRRVSFIEKVAAGAELLLNDQYHLAIRMIIPAFPRRIRSPFRHSENTAVLSDQQRRAIAMSTLELFANHGTELRDQTVIDVYNRLIATVESCSPGLSLSSYRSGKAKIFVESTRFGDLMVAVAVSDETRNIRTIHKAKGLEFRNVAVVLEDVTSLQKITQASANDESKRILYVALSRAMDRLFIVVPELPEADETILLDLGLVVLRH